MKISFVESVPQIFEYPSEASLLDDASHSASNGSPVGHNVPSLGGKHFIILIMCSLRAI